MQSLVSYISGFFNSHRPHSHNHGLTLIRLKFLSSVILLAHFINYVPLPGYDALMDEFTRVYPVCGYYEPELVIYKNVGGT